MTIKGKKRQSARSSSKQARLLEQMSGSEQHIEEHGQTNQSSADPTAVYRLIVDNVNEAIFIVQDGCFSFANRKAIQLSGYLDDELMGAPFADLVHPEDREMVVDRHQRRLRGEDVPNVYTFRVFDKNGQTRWLEIHATLIIWRDRPAVLMILNDITEHLQIETQLRASERRYKDLANSLPQIVCELDEKGNIIFGNYNAMHTFGLTPGDLAKGTNSLQFLAENRPRAVERIPLAASGRSFGPTEYLVRRKDGSIFPVDTYTGPIIRENGAPGILVIGIDITERKKASNDLETSYKQLRDLYCRLQSVRDNERSSMAREVHDGLGQQLIALKMDIAWLQSRLSPTNQALLEKARTMSDVIDTTIKIVKRISTSLRPPMLDDLGIVAAIEWHATEFQKRTGIRCHLDLNHPRDLAADKELDTMVFCVLQEALSNVAQHAGATRVKVSLLEKDGDLLLKVRDNGRGFDADKLSSSNSLGLIGIRERATAFRGEAKFTSTLGRGTALTLTVPMSRGRKSCDQNTGS